jgi:parallel beta-helix repeat protein
MRKLTIIIICLMLSTSVINIAAIGLKQSNSTDSISKSKDRDMIYVNDDGGAEYTRIQDAINAAHNGDTIFVFSGIYYENININKHSLTLIGEDKNTTIIDANGTGDGIYIDGYSYDYISGFTIRDAGQNGVNIYQSAYYTLSDCIITNNTRDGIFIHMYWWTATFHHITIMNCEIYKNNRYGIVATSENYDGGNSIKILNSTVYNNSLCGVDVTFSQNDIVSNCTIYNNGVGGGINSGRWDILNNCTVYNNSGNGIRANSEDTISHCQSYNNSGNGIYSTNSVSLSNCISYNNLGNGIYADGSHQKIQNIITYNNAGNGCTVQSVPSFTLSNSTAYNNHHGFLVDTSPNGIVSNCTAYNNTWQGFLLDSSSNIQVENCTSHDNYNGIGIIDNSHSNRITTCKINNNSFYGVYCILSNNNDLFLNDIGNTHNVYLFNSHNNWNSTSSIAYTYNGSNYFQRLGNHWNDYTGVDSNHDGIGDTPYGIGSDTDNYPLIESFEIYSELPNQPPTVSFYYQPANPTTADIINFHSTSVDLDGQIVSWQWNFGDGTYASIEHPTHRYTTSGWYTVNLTVQDDDSSTDYYEEPLYITTPFLIWSTTLSLQETGGKTDSLVFGEKIDASDDQDVYDVPKSPPGIPSYVYAYFETNFASPYDKLWNEIKQYPATYKQWNFTVQWNPSDSVSPTDLTISWSASSLYASEYTKVRLQNLATGTIVDMRAVETYTFTASALIPYHFQINCIKNSQITSLSTGWNFVSLPFNTTIQKTGLLVLYNSGEYNWTNATTSTIILNFIYTWNRNTQNYEIANTLNPGDGYWVYAYHPCDLWAQRVSGEGTDGIITTLHTTWNIMGLPANTPLSKEQLIIQYNGVEYSWTQATTSNNPTGGPIILGFLYGWERPNQQYVSSTTLTPGYSYWMYAYYNCTLLRPTI